MHDLLQFLEQYEKTIDDDACTEWKIKDIKGGTIFVVYFKPTSCVDESYALYIDDTLICSNPLPDNIKYLLKACKV